MCHVYVFTKCLPIRTELLIRQLNFFFAKITQLYSMYTTVLIKRNCWDVQLILVLETLMFTSYHHMLSEMLYLTTL